LEPDNEGFRNNLRLTEQRLTAPSQAAPIISGGTGNLDLGSLLSNPALMNMAAQMMQYPGMQSILNK
jgi:hypothetical protein